MKEFVEDPRKFLQSEPKMPPNFRLLMLGPKGAGVHTQAKRLENEYGWRVVDFLEIVQNKLRTILEMKEKPPNNVVEGLEDKCEICMSQEELDNKLEQRRKKGIRIGISLAFKSEFVNESERVRNHATILGGRTTRHCN